MDNPEKLATQGTQDEEKQSKHTTHYYTQTHINNVKKTRALLTSHILCNHIQMLEAKKYEHESPEYMAAMSTENINKNRDRNSVASQYYQMNKKCYIALIGL